MVLSIGTHLPPFTAVTTSGKTIYSQELLGKNTVLYFYPKDDTPGCTQEGKDFTLHYKTFKQLDCEIYGISRDSMQSHEKFKAKYCFPFELITDENEELCKIFDVIKIKNMYGKQVKGIERSTFLVDSNGRIQHAWRKVKVPGHVEDIINELRQLTTRN